VSEPGLDGFNGLKGLIRVVLKVKLGRKDQKFFMPSGSGIGNKG
jgi:hypothetical protein